MLECLRAYFVLVLSLLLFLGRRGCRHSITLPVRLRQQVGDILRLDLAVLQDVGYLNRTERALCRYHLRTCRLDILLLGRSNLL